MNSLYEETQNLDNVPSMLEGLVLEPTVFAFKGSTTDNDENNAHVKDYKSNDQQDKSFLSSPSSTMAVISPFNPTRVFPTLPSLSLVRRRTQSQLQCNDKIRLLQNYDASLLQLPCMPSALSSSSKLKYHPKSKSKGKIKRYNKTPYKKEHRKPGDLSHLRISSSVALLPKRSYRGAVLTRSNTLLPKRSFQGVVLTRSNTLLPKRGFLGTVLPRSNPYK